MDVETAETRQAYDDTRNTQREAGNADGIWLIDGKSRNGFGI
jgi:hypothetical protein